MRRRSRCPSAEGSVRLNDSGEGRGNGSGQFVGFFPPFSGSAICSFPAGRHSTMKGGRYSLSWDIIMYIYLVFKIKIKTQYGERLSAETVHRASKPLQECGGEWAGPSKRSCILNIGSHMWWRRRGGSLVSLCHEVRNLTTHIIVHVQKKTFPIISIHTQVDISGTEIAINSRYIFP